MGVFSGVTRVGDTRGGNWGFHPSIFFPEKPGDLFLVASSAVSPLASSSQKLTTFFCSLLSLSLSFLLLSFGCHPLESVTPPLFYLLDLVSLLFFVNLPTFFSFGCHPLKGVTRGGPPPRPPSDATVMFWSSAWVHYRLQIFGAPFCSGGQNPAANSSRRNVFGVFFGGQKFGGESGQWRRLGVYFKSILLALH